jgi:2'-5' RNA ligase
MKCAVCKEPATKKVVWADGRAYQPSCDDHVKAVQNMLTTKNGKMTELAGVKDLSETLDLVSSHVYPGLERKPGGPDNWVEVAGGLPSYIERIAKHLHYEKGMTISRAIAVAVNTVKRWAKGGTVTKHGTTKRITPKTQALAAKAVLEWNAKRHAGDLRMSEALLDIIDMTDVTDVSEEFVFDLADADIQSTSTMVALMLPRDVASKIAVDGGVPVDDMHITVLFNGELDDPAFADLVSKVKEFGAGWSTGPLKGSIGGIGTFPADPNSDNGAPWWVPVDVPGLNTMYEQLSGLAGHASEHGYTPHSTLTYVKDGETPPSPVERTPVEFSSVWVVRGNEERVEVPLGQQTGADLSECATLSSMNIADLAARANAIEDPVARHNARQKVLDLASTIPPRNARGRATDGRKSFKGQGKWKHGFIPVSGAAAEAKSKGSPIAMKRMKRLFGTPSKDAKGAPNSFPNRSRNRVVAAKGRAGSRSAGGRKRDAKAVKIDEKGHSVSEGAKDVGFLRNTEFEPGKNRPDAALPTEQKEASKSSRIPERARQNWNEIPETLKTVRNGKRYVVAEFGGKQYVTEWIGGVRRIEESALKDRKVMRTITSADAAAMSVDELRSMLANPRTPESAKKTLRKALNVKNKEAAK